MSNIYVQEPPTFGKVVLTTTLGDLDVELWSKECPKACRNFVQLCMEEFYNGTIFHRVIPNFVAQGGDPTGSGHGGESIYGEPFKNEVHSRLRFVRRGLVATANSGNNDNESQFFFTLGATQELQNKHTIFGKVTGDTLYNLVKFNDLDIDREDRPNHPPKIVKTEVISNPFPDIVPRNEAKKEKVEEKKAPKVKGTKNLKLLSFGEEETEEEIEQVPKFKSKSSHDLTDDPTLSAVPAVDNENESSDLQEEQRKIQLEYVQSKLKANRTIERPESNKQSGSGDREENSDDEKKRIAKERMDSVKEQIKSLKRELKADKGEDNHENKQAKVDDQQDSEEERNEILKDFHLERKKYSEKKNSRFGKGGQREADTLASLQKFQQKLQVFRASSSVNDKSADANEIEEQITGNDWLGHKLEFDNSTPVLARDANTKGDDWFEIIDPRNPINQRRREESKKIMKEKATKTKNDL